MFKGRIQHEFKFLLNIILLGVVYFFISTCFAAPSSNEGIQIYQKNLHLFPEHKQKLADDITRYRNADNLWDVLREDFTLRHYEENPQVQEKIVWFMNNQDFLLRSASRAAPYLYYILQQVKKRHLPAELVLLPVIESGYNPFSLSPVGAMGIWQLMPGTATGLGIKQSMWYDGRRDVISSTRGALNYLAYLQSFFEGNWLYAIAAYNTGEGNVATAIKKNIRNGLDTEFWSLPLAQQTKDYVPSLLALAIIISNPDQYPIYFPPVHNAPYLAQVDVGGRINLKYAASLAGLSYKKLTELNPGFSRSSVLKGPNKLVLPIENVEQFSENLARSPLNRQINWIRYKVKTGDTIASIAKKFDIAVVDIRTLNHLSKNSVRKGLNILIPTNALPSAPDDTDEPVVRKTPTRQPILFMVNKQKYTETEEEPITVTNMANNEYTLQPGDTVYMVRANDTLQSVAKRFHITTRMLEAANQLNGRQLSAGKELIIPTHSNTMVAPNSEFASSEPSNNKIQPGDTIYMVRRGDTIDKIAKRFRTTSAVIRLANLVDENSLSEGDKLVIPTHYNS